MTRLCLTLCCLLGAAPSLAETLRLAAPAPKRSVYGTVFGAWAKAVAAGSKGQLTIDWDFNGVRADEAALVGKVQRSQLDGAVLTSAGLRVVDERVLVLELPGVGTSWRALAAARKGTRGTIERRLESKGLALLGWGDVALVHTLSKGRPVRTPSDLKTMKVHAWRADPAASIRDAVYGSKHVRTPPSGLSRVLRAKQVEVLTAAPREATDRRWAPHFDHVVQQPVGGRVAGLVLSKRTLARLTPAQRALLRRTAAEATAHLTRASRAAHERAFKTMARRMTVVRRSAAEQAAWRRTWRTVRARLAQGRFPKRLITQVEALAGAQ